MNTNIINAGVAQVNKDRLDSVIYTAKSLIGQIEVEQNGIAARVKANEEYAKQLKALEQLDVTYASVFGTAAPATPNVNQEAIIKAIGELQKQRSESVAAKSKNLAETVVANLDLIGKSEARIADLRKRLSDLAVTEVTAAAIVG